MKFSNLPVGGDYKIVPVGWRKLESNYLVEKYFATKAVMRVSFVVRHMAVIEFSDYVNGEYEFSDHKRYIHLGEVWNNSYHDSDYESIHGVALFSKRIEFGWIRRQILKAFNSKRIKFGSEEESIRKAISLWELSRKA